MQNCTRTHQDSPELTQEAPQMLHDLAELQTQTSGTNGDGGSSGTIGDGGPTLRSPQDTQKGDQKRTIKHQSTPEHTGATQNTPERTTRHTGLSLDSLRLT